jgi:hypothetical protein
MQLPIKVITYLQDAEFEDHVIDILRSSFGDELLIETRALTTSEVLNNLFRIVVNEQRWILIHDHQKLPVEISRESTRLSNLISISLTEFRLQNSSELQKFVARSLRTFDSEKVIRKRAISRPELLVVTGTSGAPGITTVTLNLGYEISRTNNVNILDANYFRKDIAFLMGGKRGKNETKLDKRLTITTELEDLENIGVMTIADIGSVSNLGVAFSDRRAQSRTYIDLLESAGRILFLMQPENNHMFELEMFLEIIENQALSAKPYFLMNKLGNSRRERSIYKRFQARIGNHPSNFLPFDVDSLDRAKSGYCAIAEVAPRSRLRKSLLQLAHQIQPNVQ